MRAACFIIIYLFACAAFAEERATEPSLRTRIEVIEAAENDGTVRVVADLDGIIAALDTVVAPDLLARALALRCHAQLNLDVPAAAAFADRGLDIATQAKLDGPTAHLLSCRGYVREAAGDIDAALGDYIASVEHAERAGDKSALAQATVLRGSVRYYRGEHALALADMQSA